MNANAPPVGPKRFSLSEKKEKSIDAETPFHLVEIIHWLSIAGNLFDDPGRSSDR
jgi:hypothetical protein